MILHQIPSHIRMEWARSSEGREGDLDFLLEFLFSEIQRRERSQVFGSETHEGKERRKPNPTALALVANDHAKIHCAFCQRNHFSDRCDIIKNLSHDQRKEKIKSMRLCFKCLGGHLARACDRSCFFCKGPHHSTLHIHDKRPKDDRSSSANLNQQPPHQSSNDNATQTSLFVSAVGPTLSDGGSDLDTLSPNQFVKPNEREGSAHGILYSQTETVNTVMQVVQTEINRQKVTLLFDSGSDRSYIKSSTAKKLELDRVRNESLSLASFGGQRQNDKDCEVFSLHVNNTSLELLGIKQITSPLYRSAIPKKILSTIAKMNIPITENLAQDNHLHVDILIGLDFYWTVINNCSTKIIESTGLVAQESQFGWFISGCYHLNRFVNKTNLALFCISEPSEATIRRCWELDAIGVGVGGEDSPQESTILNDFSKEIQMNGGRYQVGLPWRSEAHKEMLVNNVDLAQKRLTSLTRKLDLNPDLKAAYTEVFVDLEKQGIIEEISPNEQNNLPIFYLPHRPVIREGSETTKVRPVFDASAKGINGVSLNDCLEAGPKLIPDLIKVLLRFRRWRFGLTADITKAFLQIELRKEDQSVHRFLLNKDDKVRHMQFTRVTFGNTASPFLLNATIKHHLSKFEEDRTIRELMSNLYVDDWLSGADNEDELMGMMEKAEHVLKEGGFPLAKWTSNSSMVKEKVKILFADCSEKELHKVLGMAWNTSCDCFQFETTHDAHGLVFTKRNLLGLIARQFDPLGLLTPFTVTLKILFQDVWRAGYDWDTPLPVEVQDEIEMWIENLHKINNWKIPRQITRQSWELKRKKELVVFVDASEKAYGSCLYLKTTDDSGTYVALVTSKVRVAPLKRVTLPRLELLAALLGARLLRFVMTALELSEDTPYNCWTDSKIVEGWIKGDPSRWKQFVRNRVVEIQNLTDTSCWWHVPGKENPADLLTRGVSASVLTQSSFWLQGPEWLLSCSPLREIDSQTEGFEDVDSFLLDGQTNVSVCVLTPQNSPLMDYEKFSCFSKVIRVIALVIRFIRKLKKLIIQIGCSLSPEDMNEARIVLFKDLQIRFYGSEIHDLARNGVVSGNSSLLNLSPFLDSEGLIRIYGRLDKDPTLRYEEKHPIVLPKCHVTYLMVRYQHMLMKHAGVGTLVSSLRNRYWIVSVRTLAKRVSRHCLQCRRHDSRPMDQITAPLPRDRLTQAPPFSVIGVDHAGPLYCADNCEKKMYVLLFTCAVTRAVHLELVDSLNLDDFLLAFRRFVSRRALPSIIYSDNAKTFKAASLLLQNRFSHVTISWKFICPLSPHWGGWWERLVRSMKSCLRKSVGKCALDRIELETVLQEVEACINSRPLTYIEEQGIALSPSHFLIGRGTPLASAELEAFDQVVNLSDKREFEISLIDKYWDIWKREYIRNLPPLRGKKVNRSLEVNSVVLIRDQKLPRMIWPMGIVTKLYRGLDGKVRAVEIKTSKGTLTRSIQHLTLLEFDTSDSSANEDTPLPVELPSGNPNDINEECTPGPDLPPKELKTAGEDVLPERYNFSRSRFGRKVKPREILDL